MKRAFTLIEMLVVITIIAILAALLAPGMRQAIDTAREITCANNQRLIMLAVTSYSGDYNSYFPATSGAGKGVTEGAYRRLFNYITEKEYDGTSFESLQPWSNPKVQSTYTCPSDEHPWAYKNWLYTIDPYYNQNKFSDPRIARSYVTNSSLAVYRNTTSSTPDRWSNYTTASPNGKRVRITELKKPSEALLFMDMWADFSSINAINSYTITLSKHSSNPSIESFKVHMHGNLGGLNVAFVDGRAKWVVGTYDEVNRSSDIKDAAKQALAH